MSVSSTKSVTPGDPGVVGSVSRAGSGARSTAAPQVDAAGVPFQIEEPVTNRRQSGDDGGSGSSEQNLAQRQRAQFNRDFAPLLNRAAAFTSTEPAVGHEAGPTIRVYFADVMRGVRSYEYSMRAIAANDRSTGLARGSNYSRYF